MLIACPACSTRYNVPETALGSQGRTVRCSHCGHEWLALPQEADAPVQEPAPAGVAEPAPEPAAEAAGDDRPDFSALWAETTRDEGAEADTGSQAPEEVLEDRAPETNEPPLQDDEADSPFASLRNAVQESGSVDWDAERESQADRAQQAEAALEDMGLGEAAPHTGTTPVSDDDSAVFERIEAVRRKLPDDAAASGDGRRWRRVGWAGLGAFYLVLIGGLLLFQDPISKAWPPAKRLYATLGLAPSSASPGSAAEPAREPGDILSLATPRIEYVDPDNLNAGLTVRVEISNPSSKRVSLPPMTGQALDAEGGVVFEWPVKANASFVNAGGVIDVETRINLYPEGMESLRIRFSPRNGAS